MSFRNEKIELVFKLMIKNFKDFLRSIIYKTNNCINIAPKVFTFNEIFLFINNKNLNFVPYNFYKNKEFSLFFWKEYKKFIINSDFKEKKNFSLIKLNFNSSNCLELLTIYSALIVIGKFSLALKVRKLFEKYFREKNFLFKSNYIKTVIRTINLLQSNNFNLNRQKIFFKKIKQLNDNSNAKFQIFFKK